VAKLEDGGTFKRWRLVGDFSSHGRHVLEEDIGNCLSPLHPAHEGNMLLP
jgi:hypothetical protein